ncbi:hypothetical protein BG006_007910 [Podila minutissima]|uniref:ABC transporter domain-containing protein n=1 Tax=Podila minutissima TaxID=64525 RepID=A0A9P5SJG6_9FUNG|nr:hypothetical protein BG006_007910 [Podila minutissima]
MGISGAGKSTLVDILAGKIQGGKATGHILLNGKLVQSEIYRAVEYTAEYFNRRGVVCVSSYNIADYLLDIAMDHELVAKAKTMRRQGGLINHAMSASEITGILTVSCEITVPIERGQFRTTSLTENAYTLKKQKPVYSTSFLTRLRVIIKRNMADPDPRQDAGSPLRRVGGSSSLYWRPLLHCADGSGRALERSLFFLIALPGFSRIPALGAFIKTWTLSVNERSNGYYLPAPFIISTLMFDLIPPRIVLATLIDCISY